jgi:glycosyltransferase involved in cell wall biosynthesis
MKPLEILIPTKDRVTALIATLTSLYYQSYSNFNIIISDQSQYDIGQNQTLKTLINLFRLKNINISIYRNLPPKGITEQRQFLFEKSKTELILYLDDDLILEPFVIKNSFKTIKIQNCGFVGMGLIGPSFVNDIRPNEQNIEFWQTKVKPEKILPYSKKWQRYQLHNAANLLHVQQKLKLKPTDIKPYKIAWVGACVLYNRNKLKKIGAYSYWEKIPQNAVGEDVYTQQKLMARFGACAILPSGVYHQELETTINDRNFDIPKSYHVLKKKNLSFFYSRE